MRVIAGKARGLTLAAPKGLGTRPTADRMKEDLFNIAARFVQGAAVLDLYAGSGGIGIEALSRGASECVFVERSKSAAAVLRKNIARAVPEARSEVLVQDAHSALAHLEALGRDFSFVFLDPPYDSGESPDIIAKLACSKLLRAGAVLIAETPAGAVLPEFAQLTLFRQKIYTRTNFLFWKKLI